MEPNTQQLVQTTASDASVQYQRDRDALNFIKGRIDQARAKINQRIHIQGRSATPDEKAAIAAYKAAVKQLKDLEEATGLKLVNPLGQPVTLIVPEGLSEDKVLGTSEERMTAAAAFADKRKTDLAALDALAARVEAEFHGARAGGGFGTVVESVLRDLPTE